MTLIEAINRIDALKNNRFSQEEKTRWLSVLDGRIKSEIIDTHEGGTQTFDGYDANTILTTELLVPAPYDEIYLYYLEMRIDYANGEYQKYENSATMFNTAYVDYSKYYNRTHLPISKPFKMFGAIKTKDWSIANTFVKVSLEEE